MNTFKSIVTSGKIGDISLRQAFFQIYSKGSTANIKQRLWILDTIDRVK